MEFREFGTILRTRWHIVILVTITVFLLVAFATVSQPRQYQSTVNLLVVQRYSWNMDAYNVSRSTQYLSTILAKVIYSQSFFDAVMQSGYGVENVFSYRPEKRRTEWEAMVQARAGDQSGVIAIDVYHTSREQAYRLVRAIEYVLTTRGGEYHGGGNQVTMKTIDGPFTSDRPVRPNVMLNLAIGLALGLFLSLALIALFPNASWTFGPSVSALPQSFGALAYDERGSVSLGVHSDFGQSTEKE